MIKNVIFDVDNTMFDSSIENAIYYKEALEKLGYDPNRYLDLYNAMDKYEEQLNDEDNFYKKEDMLDLINTELNENYSIELIDEINNVIGKYWVKTFLDEETLKYLYEKYDLYIFSNWFYEAPYDRLKNVGYLKYLKKIFTADKVGSKPYKNSFINVLKNIEASPEECIMVGDSLRSDIAGATNVGIKAVWFNQWNQKDELIQDKSKYFEITNLSQIKDIL